MGRCASLLASMAPAILVVACSAAHPESEFAPPDAGQADAVDDGDFAAPPDAAPPPPPPRPSPPPPAPVCSAPASSPAAAAALVSGDTDFAVALYGPAVSAAGAANNLIVSPYSASATLTMLDVGADGETDTQIQSVLHLPGNGAAVAPAYVTVACQDETDGSWTGDQLSIANAVWGQQGTAFLPGFLSVLASGYQAPMQQADFAGDPAGATSAINAWVSQQTSGLIPSLLQPGDVDEYTRIVLVDALYFKGTWETGFDPAETAPKPFTLSDGSQVQVPTMSGAVGLAMGGSKNPAVGVYELPYFGDALAMDFLVPVGSLASLESSLTPGVLDALLESLIGGQQAELSVPKFSFGTRLVLNDLLSNMGMPDAFEPGVANFFGIDGTTDLYVSTVVQQALVEVDEEGTVAAAATAGGGSESLGSFTPPVVLINSPFLFLIRDTKNGSILFMGRVLDPRGT